MRTYARDAISALSSVPGRFMSSQKHPIKRVCACQYQFMGKDAPDAVLALLCVQIKQ
ncbi:hypothetical protein DSECCO2_160740 [anaerobic digester metagenome]